MELKKQVCSLELAKKLKELGVKQESLFYYYTETGNGFTHKGFVYKTESGKYYGVFSGLSADKPDEEVISAFTVAELGEMLQGRIVINKYIDSTWGVYWCDEKMNEFSKHHTERDSNEVDCLAKMLIYLVGNKLVEVK